MIDKIDLIDFSEHVYYDSSSPSGLRWLNDRYGGVNDCFIRRPKDSQAGAKMNLGYWQLRLEGRMFLVHRIIWKIVKQESIAGKKIDHVDGNRSNNNISNLRLVSQKENSRNSSLSRNNRTGFTGVVYDPRLESRGTPRYIACWTDLNGKQSRKSFAIGRYGEELAEFLAIEYRRHQIDLMNIAGAGYTDRHGE